MHSSLKLPSNLIMIGACLAVVAGTTMMAGAFPTIAWALAAAFGVAAGELQGRSIGSATDAFRSARTSVEVRTALMSNLPGRLSVLLQWAIAPILLVAAYLGGNLIAGALGGYALFMAVRDLVALRAVMSLTAS